MSMSPHYSTPQPPPPPPPVYSPYPMPPPVQGQAQAAIKTNWLYALPLVGGLVLAGGLILPWISFAFASSFVSMESSINGFGGCGGSVILCTGVIKNLHYSPADASVILGLACVALIVAVIGLTTKDKRGAIWQVGAVCGLLAGGIALYDLINFSGKLDSVTRDANAAGDGAVIAAAQTGLGLYIAVLGALIVVGGFALAGLTKRKGPGQGVV